MRAWRVASASRWRRSIGRVVPTHREGGLPLILLRRLVRLASPCLLRRQRLRAQPPYRPPPAPPPPFVHFLYDLCFSLGHGPRSLQRAHDAQGGSWWPKERVSWWWRLSAPVNPASTGILCFVRADFGMPLHRPLS